MNTPQLELVANDVLRMLLHYLRATHILNLSETTPRMRNRLQGNVTELRYDEDEKRMSKFPLVRTLSIYDLEHLVDGVEYLTLKYRTNGEGPAFPQIYVLPSRLVCANLFGCVIKCKLPPTLRELTAQTIKRKHLRESNLVSLNLRNIVSVVHFEFLPKTLTSCVIIMDEDVFESEDLSRFERFEVLNGQSCRVSLGFSPDTLTSSGDNLLKMVEMFGVRPNMQLYGFDVAAVSRIPGADKLRWKINQHILYNFRIDAPIFVEDLPTSTVYFDYEHDNLRTKSGNYDGVKFPPALESFNLFAALPNMIGIVKALESTKVSEIRIIGIYKIILDLSPLKHLRTLHLSGCIEINPIILKQLEKFSMDCYNGDYGSSAAIRKCALQVLEIRGEMNIRINESKSIARSVSDIDSALAKFDESDDDDNFYITNSISISFGY